MTGHRLTQGGRIDRSARIRFHWDGQAKSGFKGDSLASALLASGEMVLGRSFKYHRPRGVMSAGTEEGGAIVSLHAGARRETNAKAPMVELYEGLEAFGQNAWPSVRTDLGAINSLMGRFFAAGFYYKTFMGVGKGTWEWMQFEKLIRRAAGMGAASREDDPDHYEIVNDHCDVLIAGSGPAGLSAALTCASAGLDVILVEQDFEMGGAILSGADPIGDQDPDIWRGQAMADLAAADNVRLWPRSTAFGLYDGAVVGVLERVTDHMRAPSPHLPRHRMRIVRPKHVILATGAIERPIAFGDNDRPGAMLANAASAYAHRFGVAAGSRAVIATAHDGGYASALRLATAGIETTLLDARELAPAALTTAAMEAGVEVMAGYVPIAATGRSAVRGLQVGRHRRGGAARMEREIACDVVGVSGGWTPVVSLLSHRGVKPVWNDALTAFLPGSSAEPVTVAGSAAGIWGADDCVASGHAAATICLKAIKGTGRAARMPEAGGWKTPLTPVYEVSVEGRKLKSFIDPQHDVTTDDVRQAHREGFVSVEHMKRYTTLGMATDQGRMGNVIGLALMADASGKSIPETGTTTFRPPYAPVAIGALAGGERAKHWRPTRLTPMHAEVARDNPVWTEAGAWLRAWYFPRQGEDITAAARREVATTRNAVGMIDVSTLGKIAVQGPDATEFLNRLYTNPFAKLPVGKCRYGIMLRDDGIVFDDGTTWRLAEHDYFMTTTTANAGPVMTFMERLLQTRWTDLKVHIASISDQWGGAAIAGPNARACLAALIADVDFADEGFPFMGVRDGRMSTDSGLIPVRIARISFSGEHAYEVYAPADYCAAMWRAMKDKVLGHDGCLYGMEALDCMRVEKGHVTARELDGRTTIEDVGLGKMASPRKSFIGSALRNRPDMARADRPSLVGLEPVAPGATFRSGSILCRPNDIRGHGLGWISSVADSPTLDKWIGLGFVAGGLPAFEGTVLTAADPTGDQFTEVRVVSPHFYDPSGSRMHG